MMKGWNRFNCHNRITQLNWGQATHLDYMCTCAISEPIAGGIVLAGGCAKSITQTDPSCWTSWRSLAGFSPSCTCSALQFLHGCTVSWVEVSSSIMLCPSCRWSLILNSQEDKRHHRNMSLGISFPQNNVMYFYLRVSSSTVKTRVLISVTTLKGFVWNPYGM